MSQHEKTGEPASAMAPLIAALKAARACLVVAIRANIDPELGFDPAEHKVIRQIDVALASAEGR